MHACAKHHTCANTEKLKPWVEKCCSLRAIYVAIQQLWMIFQYLTEYHLPDLFFWHPSMLKIKFHFSDRLTGWFSFRPGKAFEVWITQCLTQYMYQNKRH
jgi:hypothetical protein